MNSEATATKEEIEKRTEMTWLTQRSSVPVSTSITATTEAGVAGLRHMLEEAAGYSHICQKIYEFLQQHVHPDDLDHYVAVCHKFQPSTRFALLGLLHDIGEDYEELLPQIYEISELTTDDITVLDAVTRKRGEQYFDYIERISTNRDASEIKMADLRVNMARCVAQLEKRFTQLKRYVKAYEILQKSQK